MTNEEAIEMLTAFRKEDKITKMFRKLNNKAVDEQKELLDLCIESLEKQIPKSVQWETDYTWGNPTKQPVCPVCDYYITRHEFFGDGRAITYCDSCGQSIDWSEEE